MRTVTRYQIVFFFDFQQMTNSNQSLNYFYESFIPMRIIQINGKTRSFSVMKLIHFDMVPYQLHRASLMGTRK